MSDDRRDDAADRWQPPASWTPPSSRPEDKPSESTTPPANPAQPAAAPPASATPPAPDAPPRRDPWQTAPDPWRTTPPVSAPQPKPAVPPLPWERRETTSPPEAPVRAPDLVEQPATPAPQAPAAGAAPSAAPPVRNPFEAQTPAPTRTAPDPASTIAAPRPPVSAPVGAAATAAVTPASAPPIPSVPPLGAPKTDEPTRAWRASELAEPKITLEPAKPADDARRPAAEVKRLRRGRLAIRKFDPISVFRFSLVFQFCAMLIGLLAVGLIYVALRAIGVLGNFEEFMAKFTTSDSFSVSGGKILFYGFIIGCIWTVASTIVLTFGAFLYNLIADIVGGVELIVVERDER